MEKRYCHNCGAELKPGAKFCVKCGAKVPDTVVLEAINPNKESSSQNKTDKRSAAWWLSLIGFLTSIVSLFGYIPTPWMHTFYATNSLWLCVPSLVLCIISLVLGRDKDKDLKSLAVAGLVIDGLSIIATIVIVIVLISLGLGGYQAFWSASSSMSI